MPSALRELPGEGDAAYGRRLSLLPDAPKKLPNEDDEAYGKRLALLNEAPAAPEKLDGESDAAYGRRVSEMVDAPAKLPGEDDSAYGHRLLTQPNFSTGQHELFLEEGELSETHPLSTLPTGEGLGHEPTFASPAGEAISAKPV